MFEIEMNYWHWWVAGVVLAAVEMVIPGGVFLWLGLSAGVLGLILLTAPDLSWQVQFLVFALLSMASVMVVRVYLKRQIQESDHPNLNRRLAQYVGRTVVLESEVANGRGHAYIDDSLWAVECEESLPAGARVKVTGTDGMLLRVERV